MRRKMSFANSTCEQVWQLLACVDTDKRLYYLVSVLVVSFNEGLRLQTSSVLYVYVSCDDSPPHLDTFKIVGFWW